MKPEEEIVILDEQINRLTALLRECAESIKLSEWVHVENVERDEVSCNCEICDLLTRTRKEIGE